MAVEAAKCFAEHGTLHEASSFLISLDLPYIIIQICQSVREAIGEKDAVLVVFKLVRER